VRRHAEIAADLRSLRRLGHGPFAAIPRPGNRLITRTLDAARTFGLTRVELTVREDNRNAIALYEKVGFVTEGLQRNGALVDGEYENIIEMAILL